MQNKSLVRTRQIVWTPPVLEVETSSCSKCGHTWQYTGDRMMTRCPNCHSPVVILPSVYENIRALRNKDRIPYKCKFCGFDGLKGKNRRYVKCGGCQSNLLIGEPRRRGGQPTLQNAMIECLKTGRELNIYEMAVELKSTAGSVYRAIGTLGCRGLIRQRSGPKKTILYSLNANQ